MKQIILVYFLFISAYVYSQNADSVTINYNFIDSYPQNADVFIGNEKIGNTPLYFTWSDSLFPKSVKISIRGFKEESFTAEKPEIIKRKFNLKPDKPGFVYDPVKENKPQYFKTPRKVFPVVVSSLLTAASGIGSFYFKSLASDNKKEYEFTGDPSALDRQKQYDLLGGVSIVALQLGFGALMYFLFID